MDWNDLYLLSEVGYFDKQNFETGTVKSNIRFKINCE